MRVIVHAAALGLCQSMTIGEYRRFRHQHPTVAHSATPIRIAGPRIGRPVPPVGAAYGRPGPAGTGRMAAPSPIKSRSAGTRAARDR